MAINRGFRVRLGQPSIFDDLEKKYWIELSMMFACWKVLCQLAPWLLLGMLLSGLLHVFLPTGFVRRKFHGLAGVFKAVLLGVPLPLCSCGVVPAGIGLKNQGASNGASVGFLISTPQTGVDSILVAASFFGWPFAIFKMIAAAVTGVVGGWLTDLVHVDPVDDSDSNIHSHSHTDDSLPAWRRVWDHAIEIVRSIWGWLLIGVVVSAAIEVLIPDSVLVSIGQWGLVPAMFLVLLFSVPLYVCATASVPIAAVLVAKGLPAGAALVFLMAGPATNVTTIGAIYGRFGWKTLLVYLATIIFGSIFLAWAFDWLLTGTVAIGAGHVHDHRNWWSIGSAVILLAMIASFAWKDANRWLRGRQINSGQNAVGLGDGELTIKIGVEGMTCGGCVDKLETALNKTPGVESAHVDLKTEVATIKGQPNLSDIKLVIVRLGFRVVS